MGDEDAPLVVTQRATDHSDAGGTLEDTADGFQRWRSRSTAALANRAGRRTSVVRRPRTTVARACDAGVPSASSATLVMKPGLSLLEVIVGGV